MKYKILIILLIMFIGFIILNYNQDTVIITKETIIEVADNYTYTVNYPMTNMEKLDYKIVSSINNDIDNFIKEYENITSDIKHELFIDYEIYNINNFLISLKITSYVNSFINNIEVISTNVINYDIVKQKEYKNNEIFSVDILDDINIKESTVFFTNKNIVFIENNQEHTYEYDEFLDYFIDKKMFLDIKEKNNNKNTSVDIMDFSINSTLSKNDKMVALTFDDGPHYKYTNQILEVLKEYNSNATFFVVGNSINNNEMIIKKILENGNEIGNHTFSHRNLVYLSKDKIINEIEKCNNSVFKVSGYTPKIIRPTYGILNKNIKSVITDPIVLWNIDPEDWKYKNSNYIVNNVLKNIDDGDIILLHDIYKHTAKAVEKLVPLLIEQGYKLVTVSDLYYYKKDKLIKNNVYIE